MSNPVRYKLEVNLAIQKEEWNGPVTPDGLADESREHVGHWSSNYNNERLTVSESMQLGAMNFLGLMRVLGQLHDAIKAVKDEE